MNWTEPRFRDEKLNLENVIASNRWSKGCFAFSSISATYNPFLILNLEAAEIFKAAKNF